ncbi:DUF1565 domain-containing protein [Brevundimonas variabilis]|uniref:Right handed beta helix domain-containing protein n=1 Tax=Brevundimonas variabilis TaxID=74312 RepID=A0A7W9CK29_9CAUL|nr:DUF1565 domain-containing protein [Brevundimonas variabilis]MBB5747143.1 hypothetical protein [Brevundimonas variabilis]
MLALLAALSLQAWSLPAARACSAAEIEALTAPVDSPYRLTCRATLSPGQSITRRILIEGAEGSGSGIDCRGGSLGVPGRQMTTRAPTIAVWSRRIEGPSTGWSRPTDVTIRNCQIHGNVRLWGMGAGGSMSDLLDSSRSPGHTAAVQAAAPSNIRFEAVAFVGTGSIPLYVGPGVTATQVLRGRFGGRSESTALYLDAESRDARIEGVVFDVATAREQIAIDGSAGNVIAGNRFSLGGRGGIFLYRNCGEDGVIRHQTPSENRITDNVFSGAARFRPRTVVVGAREGNRRYCGDDAGYPFGSSADDGDGATRNVVARNRIVR